MCISHVHMYMCEFHMCSWICATHMCVNMCTVEFTTYYLLLPPFRHPFTFHAPGGPPGRQQEAPQEPPRTPEKAHIKHFFFSDVFQILSVFCCCFFFRFLLVFSCQSKQPQEAPKETARRKPPEGQDGPVMCMICAAISRAQGGPTCSQCSQQC